MDLASATLNSDSARLIQFFNRKTQIGRARNIANLLAAVRAGGSGTQDPEEDKKKTSGAPKGWPPRRRPLRRRGRAQRRPVSVQILAGVVRYHLPVNVRRPLQSLLHPTALHGGPKETFTPPPMVSALGRRLGYHDCPEWFGRQQFGEGLSMKAAERRGEFGAGSRKLYFLRYEIKDRPDHPVKWFRFALYSLDPRGLRPDARGNRLHAAARIWIEIPADAVKRVDYQFVSRKFSAHNSDNESRSVADMSHLSDGNNALLEKNDTLKAFSAGSLNGDYLFNTYLI